MIIGLSSDPIVNLLGLSELPLHSQDVIRRDPHVVESMPPIRNERHP